MADPETIYNWRRLDDRITTSGQPTESQLAEIHALGVRHVINLGLHSHEKALPVEATSVTPWAARALDRALAAIVVALGREKKGIEFGL